MSVNSIFHSLSCCVCKMPYIAMPNNRRSPRKLKCGASMCLGCFQEELPKTLADRRHKCHQRQFCLNNRFTAFFILNILESDALQLTEGGTGYHLVNHFQPLRCPRCKLAFSMTEQGKAPRDLYCNHCVCIDCFLVIRKPSQTNPGAYDVICPTCGDQSFTKCRDPCNNAFCAFLLELPGMTREYVLRKQLASNNIGQVSSSTPIAKDLVVEEKNTAKPFKYPAACPKTPIELEKDAKILSTHFGLKLTTIFLKLNSSEVIKFERDFQEFTVEFKNLSTCYAQNRMFFIERMLMLLARFDMKFAEIRARKDNEQ